MDSTAKPRNVPTLRRELTHFRNGLASFMARAGRRNANIVALTVAIDEFLASGDRALDVADPIELSRGYQPPKPPESPP